MRLQYKQYQTLLPLSLLLLSSQLNQNRRKPRCCFHQWTLALNEISTNNECFSVHISCLLYGFLPYDA